MAGWLNQLDRGIQSLLEKDLEYWLLSLRSYLVNNNKYQPMSGGSVVNSSGQLCKYQGEDKVIYAFKGIYKTLQDIYDDRDEYEKDVWDAQKLGYKPSGNSRYSLLDFTRISQSWLRVGAKRFIKYQLAHCVVNTCIIKLIALNKFSEFLEKKYPYLKPSNINRAIIVDYINYAPTLTATNNTRLAYLTNLRQFLSLCVREKWLDIPERELIYDDDLPRWKRQKQPRYIPQEVLDQLNKHLDLLPLHIKRILLILQKCGMRISELCTLQFSCLLQDNHGDYFLRYYQHKMNKEHSIPISKTTAKIIQEQQQHVIQQWGRDFSYLFPTPKPAGKGKPIAYTTILHAINKLGYEQNICGSTGNLWRFQLHQFRHTVETAMINNGVPQHIVQRYLGHESPEMTAIYDHIHDQTLKEEFAKFQSKMVDVTGKVVEAESVAAAIAYGVDPNEIDAQWLKKNIRAQALPNGLCGLPANQPVCPYSANKCLTGPDGKGCPHFKTDIRYLDKHKEHLARTNEIVEWAQENPGAKRAEEILKVNMPVKQNLESVVASLESQRSVQQ